MAANVYISDFNPKLDTEPIFLLELDPYTNLSIEPMNIERKLKRKSTNPLPASAYTIL